MVFRFAWRIVHLTRDKFCLRDVRCVENLAVSVEQFSHRARMAGVLPLRLRSSCPDITVGDRAWLFAHPYLDGEFAERADAVNRGEAGIAQVAERFGFEH